MKIIIKIKDTATLSRIEEFGKFLVLIGDGGIHTDEFRDVIESIDREW